MQVCNNKWVESHQKINKNLPNVLNSEIVRSTFIKHQKEVMTKQAAFSKLRSCTEVVIPWVKKQTLF